MLVLGLIFSAVSVFLLTNALVTFANNRSEYRIMKRGSNKNRQSTITRHILKFAETLGRYRGVIKSEETRQRLRTAGNPLQLSSEQFLGIQMISCAVILLLSLPASRSNWLFAPLGASMGWLYPELWLSDKKRNRQQQIKAQLPFAIDLLNICIEAGLNFDGALAKVVDVLPQGPLLSELDTVLKEMRMGQSRREALSTLARRVDVQEISSLTSTLIQADQLGTGVSSALPVLAEQLRTRRINAAEASAAKAPIKMLFPLVALIFPCILIILFVPIFLSGALNM